MNPATIEVETADEAASSTNPWTALLGTATGIGGLLFSVFEWIYQQRLQRWQAYWNALISKVANELNMTESAYNMYQSLASNYQTQAQSYKNAIFNSNSKAQTNAYLSSIYSDDDLSDSYKALANSENKTMTMLNNLETEYKKQEGDFSFWNSDYSTANSYKFHNNGAALHDKKFLDVIKSFGKNTESLSQQLNQIIKGTDSVRTVSGVKKLNDKLNKLYNEMKGQYTWLTNERPEMIAIGTDRSGSMRNRKMVSRNLMKDDRKKSHPVNRKTVIRGVKITKH